MRRAIVEISAEIAADVIGVILDHGLRIVRSLEPPEYSSAEVHLLIEGDALPRECEEAIWRVAIVMTTEAYGKQRMHKISEIKPWLRLS